MKVAGRALEPLERAFFARRADAVARALLGMLLVSTIDDELTVGRIVETEAYIGPHDPASHAAERIGRTMRNDAMFGEPGIAYVYRIYGIHWSMNAVADHEGFPAGVLLRGVEPVDGIDVMRRRRGVRDERQLASGPGKLAAAFGITGAHNHHPLNSLPLMIAAGKRVRADAVVRGPRIGVTRAHDWPLRFFVRGNAHVSR